MRIYLAAPLFTSAERAFNLSLCKAVEMYAQVYLPQRDGILLSEERGGSPCDERIVAAQIYRADVAAIEDTDVLLAVLDGALVDDGVAFELGYAAALGKTCVGYSSDSRRADGYFRNPMWLGSLSAEPFKRESDLLDYLLTLTERPGT